MKILYNSVSSEYLYPLSNKDIRRIRDYIPSEILDLISCIRFGCNVKTHREGRIVKRGRFYDIRINFCLRRVGGPLQSLIQSDTKEYIEEVKRYGGKLDLNTKTISWELQDAKRYAFYILLHEIGHIVYSEKHLKGQLGWKGSRKEEKWCYDYSMRLMKQMRL